MKNSVIAHSPSQGKFFSILACWFFLVLSLCRAHAAAVVWTNSTGGNWSAATNWSPNNLPGGADDVFITNNGNYTVTLDLANITIGTLTLGATSGSTTQSVDNAAHNLNANQILIGSNGVLNVSGGFFNSTLNLHGNANWTGGAFGGQVTVATNGALNLGGVATKLIAPNTTMTNNGLMLVTGGAVSFQGAGVICNQSLLHIQCDQNQSWGASSDLINTETGVLMKSGAGTSTIQLNFRSLGLVTNVSGSGPLVFSYSSVVGGTVSAGAGTTITFASVCDCFNILEAGHQLYAAAGGAIYCNGPKTRLNTGNLNSSGAGTNKISGAVYCAVPITNLTLEAGSFLTGTNSVSPFGSLTLSNGYVTGFLTVETNGTNYCFGTTTIGNASAVTNKGTMFVGGLINVFTAPGLESFICNEVAGRMVLLSNASFCCTATLINAGTLYQPPGAGTNIIQLDFVNTPTGTVTNAGGNLALTYSARLNGIYAAGPGATNRFASVCDCFNILDVGHQFYAAAGGANYLNGPKTRLNTGVLNKSGAGITEIFGAVYYSVPITNLTLGAGTSLAGTNLLEGTMRCQNMADIEGYFTIATNGTLVIETGTTIGGYGSVWTNYGTLYLTNGAINFQAAPGFITGFYNMPSGKVLFCGDGSMENTPSFIYNAGLFQKLAGVGVSSIEMNFTNAGKIKVDSGEFRFGQYDFDPMFLLPTSVLEFAIAGSTNGSQHGRVVCRNVEFNGALSIALTDGFVPDAGERFTLMTLASHSGGFWPYNAPDLSTNKLFLLPHGEPNGLVVEVISTNAPDLPLATNLVDADVAFGEDYTWPEIRVAETIETLHTYQWLSNEVVLAEETNATLFVEKVQTTNTYRVVLDGNTNLSSAVLRPLRPPYFIVKPAGLSVSNGASVNFSASVGGDGPFTYQWLLNGSPIDGATSPTLTLNTAQPTDSGSYSLIVANRVGRTNSTPPAELLVDAPGWPFADFFTNAVNTNSLGFVVAGTNALATFEPGELPHADYGTNSVWLKWTPPADTDGFVTVTMGSSVDVLLGVYTNPTNGVPSVTNRTVVATDDDSGGHLMPLIRFNAKAGNTYWFAVAGFWSQSGRFVLRVNEDTNITSAPQIPPSGQPADTVTTNGGNASFTVFANSTTNLYYQWTFNDFLANPAWTNQTLSLTNVGIANVGLYRVVVSTPDGQRVSSRVARLELGQELSGDKLSPGKYFPSVVTSFANFSGGNHLMSAGSFTSVGVGTLGTQNFSTFGSTSDPTEPVISHTVPSGPTRWIELTATNNGTLVIDTVGSQFDTLLAVYTGSDIFSLVEVAEDNNGAPDGLRSRVQFPAVNGTSYLVGVSGVNGAAGNVALNVRMGNPPTVSGTATTNTLNQSSMLTLSAGATTGNPSPRYQWYVNGLALAGATNASYVITNVLYARRGTYGVLVSNLVGTASRLVGAVNLQIPFQLMWDGNAHPPGYRVAGIATQTTVLQLSTNLTVWQSLFTNTDATLPINFLDTNSSVRPNGFYKLKPWP